jgi:hypothetical protein
MYVDELSRIKKELIDSFAQHTNALSIMDAKDQALRKSELEKEDLRKELKVRNYYRVTQLLIYFI